jgi:hypothetical protein
MISYSCHDEDGQEALSLCSTKAHAAFSLGMVTSRTPLRIAAHSDAFS